MRRGGLAGVLVAFAASAGTFAASASATSPDASLQRSCTALLGAVQRVVLHASTTHVATITGHFEAMTPGNLTGVISFDRTGTTISVAADPSTASQGCAAGSTGPGVPRAGAAPGSSRPCTGSSRRPVTTPSRSSSTRRARRCWLGSARRTVPTASVTRTGSGHRRWRSAWRCPTPRRPAKTRHRAPRRPAAAPRTRSRPCGRSTGGARPTRCRRCRGAPTARRRRSGAGTRRR